MGHLSDYKRGSGSKLPDYAPKEYNLNECVEDAKNPHDYADTIRIKSEASQRDRCRVHKGYQDLTAHFHETKEGKTCRGYYDLGYEQRTEGWRWFSGGKIALVQ